jgi:GT2 family glycosyltransferase
LNASVVITTKNRKEELLKAVESALRQHVLLEVIVIDDGSTDGTAEELKKKFSVFSFQSPGEQPVTTDSLLATAPEALSLDSGRSTLDPQTAAKPLLRFIRNEVSAGYIIRRNEGARVARGDVIFSLDDDAVFSSAFVVEQTLRDFSHPRIGAVAIPYIEPHKANKEMQRAPTREDVWITASYIGTAHAVRRDVFLALGGYREHLVHQGEEGDFCLRMLAADAAQVMSDSGGRETERDLFNHGGHREHGGLVCSEAGLRPDSRAVASESDSLASGLADSPISESLTRSARGPAPLATSYSLPVTAPEVPGFFVRLGNSDPIIHNESPKRDFSRMDFYGRRNDVLFHWQNTPMPDLLWQLPMTIAGGLLCAYRVKRWEKMACGIISGIFEVLKGATREPVGKKHFRFYKQLKTCGPSLMEK